MEYDFIDNSMWDNADRIYNHIEELEREYEELTSDLTNNNYKIINSMETKELKIQAPKGFEIDKENSTFECIRFKPINKGITYDDVCNHIFNICNGDTGYYIEDAGNIKKASGFSNETRIDKNNATNVKQLKRLLALNKLLNNAEYYNKSRTKTIIPYKIIYDKEAHIYKVLISSAYYISGTEALFMDAKDAQTVIDNPNFQEILDTIYKDQ